MGPRVGLNTAVAKRKKKSPPLPESNPCRPIHGLDMLRKNKIQFRFHSALNDRSRSVRPDDDGNGMELNKNRQL
jgi:hypothetical protein